MDYIIQPDKYSVIRLYDDMNNLFDMVVIVEKSDEGKAQTTLRRAYEEWYEIDDPFDCMREHLLNALKMSGVYYEAYECIDEYGRESA